MVEKGYTTDTMTEFPTNLSGSEKRLVMQLQIRSEDDQERKPSADELRNIVIPTMAVTQAVALNTISQQ